MDTVTHVSDSEYNLFVAEAQRYSNSGAYISAIRNPAKKFYAHAYREYLMGRRHSPEHGCLSYMAAQAVRINLHRILAID